MMHQLRISAPEHRSGLVAADVAGTRVSFSSPDAVLRPAAEAFAGAMWLPALHGGVELVLSAPADRTWQSNLMWAAALAQSWWGYGPSRLRTAGVRPISPPADATVLCFTGGVDSFYSLLGGSPRPDAVVFAHGFDIGLGDEDRWRHAERGMRAVAAALGVQAIAIRSDLRSHPSFASISWEITHGAALAALGHLLAGDYGTIVISSTHARDDGRVWGSDWRLDPLWSASDLRVEHRGADVPREQKLRALSSHPLVRAHLRVCWEHLNGRLNCGRCDKCLAAMVTVHCAGALEHFAAFDGSNELLERLDDLPTTRYLSMYPRLLADGVPEPIGAAVRRLVERST